MRNKEVSMKYKITVRRTGYAWRDIEIEAKDIREAQEAAAFIEYGDFEYSEKDADYDIESITEV
jgi:hypothetical protein